MHYYRFSIGDYRRDTQHLTLLEHGIYRQLIDLYYMEESPLPPKERLMRLLCVRNADEERSLCDVLADFFKEDENGNFHHFRCDEEIQELYKKSEKARNSAKARWDKIGKLKEKHNVIKDNADAMRTHSECNANAMLPSNPVTQLPNKILMSKPTVSTCPHEAIIACYQKTLPELQKVVVSRWKGSARAKTLETRWREDDKHQDIKFWEWFFSSVRTNPHWMGENERAWKADLGWLLERRNFDKVIEKAVSNGT